MTDCIAIARFKLREEKQGVVPMCRNPWREHGYYSYFSIHLTLPPAILRYPFKPPLLSHTVVVL